MAQLLRTLVAPAEDLNLVLSIYTGQLTNTTILVPAIVMLSFGLLGLLWVYDAHSDNQAHTHAQIFF